MFERFVEPGRLALITYGPCEGKMCTVVDIVDQKRVVVDGPTSVTGVARHMMPVKRLSLTDFKATIPRGAREKTLKTALDDMLQTKGISTLFTAGIATDVCVQWTATDALGPNTANYDVKVIKDATAAVLGSEENYKAAIGTMAAAGAEILTTADVLAMQCPSMTCGDLKKTYKDNECCGAPNKVLT